MLWKEYEMEENSWEPVRNLSNAQDSISKFHESLTEELKDTNIVNFSVHPGVVKTELGSAEGAMNKAHSEHPAVQSFFKMLSSSHMKGQTPEDVPCIYIKV